jgi:DnaJ-class molecular chaperone
MKRVPRPARVALTTACPFCGGSGFAAGASLARCAACHGSGRSAALHHAFELAELSAALERMRLDTSTRRSR